MLELLLAFTLLAQTDLEYVGAFRFPVGSFGCSGVSNCFSYGGAALAYNPSRNSLFLAGHDHEQKIAEISIPTPSKATTFTSLPIATVLQPFVDGTEGRLPIIDDGSIKIGGLLVVGDHLYMSAYSYYDANTSQELSHFRRPINLSQTGNVIGPFKVGSSAGFTSGYMTHIPNEQQSAFGGSALTGNCCIPIVTRTSYGPAAFSFKPEDIGILNPVPAKPLVYYDSSHKTLGDWNQQSDYFNSSASIHGVVFPKDTKSVLFWGKIGIGKWCYGPGTADKSLEGTLAPSGQLYCYDPVVSATGNHAYPYVYQVWAYNSDEMRQAVNPWNVKPYAIWRPSLPFANWNAELGSVAYDPATQRLYVVQKYASSFGQGVVYVYKVNAAAGSVPNAPTGLVAK